MERRGLGMVLGCGSPPLLAVVRIDEAYSAAGKTWFGWWLVEH